MGANNHVEIIGPKPADSRGRVTLGAEYAGSEVELVVVSIDKRETAENEQ